MRRMEDATTIQAPKPDPGFVVALLLAVLSLLVTAYGVAIACGLWTIAPIVGGDVYNIIIAGIRGLAWIGAGFVAALLAILSFLLSRP